MPRAKLCAMLCHTPHQGMIKNDGTSTYRPYRNFAEIIHDLNSTFQPLFLAKNMSESIVYVAPGTADPETAMSRCTKGRKEQMFCS